MSNCKNIQENIMEFIDGELSIDDTNLILAHLSECKSCKEKIDKEIALRNLVRKNIEKTPPNFSFELNKNIYKCFETGNKLVEFTDGGLTIEDRKTISAHLLECAYCRQEYDKIKEFNAIIKTSLTKTHFENILNVRKLISGVICENKKHTIVVSSAIASCVMIASLVSFSSIDSKNFTEVSFKKEEIVQEKAEQIVLKDINEETLEDSQKLIYEIK